MSRARVVLLSKADRWSNDAAVMARAAFPALEHHSGTRFDPFPEIGGGPIDVLLSFLSPWIVPEPLLRRSALAINFHPASAAYPGIGCYNFALYEGAAEYGAVAHHMAPRVDTGSLIAERRFPVFAGDSVETLKLRTLVVMTALYAEIVGMLAAGKPLPECAAVWERRPFTRRELDALATVDPGMPPEEIARRVRATTYPGFPGTEVELGGVRFSAPVPSRAPYA